MASEQEIIESLNDVARAFHEHVGQGKSLGTIEAGEAMRVADRTVLNYTTGRTTGAMELVTLLRFAAAYRARFPSLTDPVAAAVCRVFGGQFVREEHDDAFVDANGNGRPDPGDAVIHQGKAIEALAENLGATSPTATASEVDVRLANLDRAIRHGQATRRVYRTVARAGGGRRVTV